MPHLVPQLLDDRLALVERVLERLALGVMRLALMVQGKKYL